MTDGAFLIRYALSPVVLVLLIAGVCFWGAGLRRAGAIPPGEESPYTLASGPVAGLIVYSWLLGWMVYFESYSALLAGGLLLAGAAVSWKLVPLPELRSRDFFRPAALFTALTVLARLLPPHQLNREDDGTAYAVFPIKLLALGRLGTDPFSDRRLMQLGAHFGLQALALAVVPIQQINIIEPVLGIALSLVVLTLLTRNKPNFGYRLIAASLFIWLCTVLGRGNIFRNLAPSFLVVPPLIVLAVGAGQEVGTGKGSAVRTAGLGLLGAYAICLRPTTAVVVCFLLAVAILRMVAKQQGSRIAAFMRAASIATVAGATFILPFALDQVRHTGSLFYPILGRGYPGSLEHDLEKLISRLSWSEHLHNMVVLPATDWLVITATVLFVIRMAASWRTINRRLQLGIFVAFFVSNLGIIYTSPVHSDPALDAQRYASPTWLAYVMYLLCTIELGEELKPRILRSWLPGLATVVTVIILGVSFQPALRTKAMSKMQERLEGAFPSGKELRAYSELDAAIPPGTVVMAYLEGAYLLDMKRHTIWLNDVPVMTGPPPGWPRQHGHGELAKYLGNSGVDYVAVMHRHHTPESLAASAALPPDNFLNLYEGAIARMFTDLESQPFQAPVYESDYFRVYKVP